MHSGHRSFIPAAGHDFALPLYDPLTDLFGASARRQILIDRADLRAGQRVLDVGCGTGSLSIALKRAQPELRVTGLDPDPRALDRARRKAARAHVQVQYERGFGDALPFADATFARVFSSFMLHHLQPAAQLQLLKEALRVLEPAGSLHLIDFTREHGRLFGRDLHGAEDGARALTQAGFVDVRVEAQKRWLFQGVVYCTGRRAAA
ncbi:MAG TPA: methyltransferase domain-containing protein [Polyangiales bacterium]|nr:methyltransferase domain-containing protein [Polyangiales bacterium]